jgi:hypothetical protein
LPPEIDLDLPLWNADAIGRFIGIDVDTPEGMRKAFHVCEILKREGIVKKVGRQLTATPQNLRARFGA